MTDLNDPRVLFAAERTLLAWNRTSLSFIAFGFVLERAGIFIRTISPGTVHPSLLVTTFWFGVIFILLGSVVAMYSAKQYAIVLSTLKPSEFPPRYAAKWGLTVNVVVAVMGALLAAALIVWRS